jgi:rhamnosyltransferase
MPATHSAREVVDAIVVTYRPDIDRLNALLDATVPQVRHTYVVDNGDGTALRVPLATRGQTSLVPMGKNMGIAAAQNAGARAAIAAGAGFILLLDQDSVPADDMVARLHAGLGELTSQGHRIAAVGPGTPSGEAPANFVRFGWFRYRNVPFRDDDLAVFCDLLIASGSLIPVHAWRDIGSMDESLFIDKVDTEWCIRAAQKDYRLAGIPSATLHHSMGERNVRVWWGRWRHLPEHKPFRYYYIVRNGLIISQRHRVTWRWRTADARESLMIAVLFGIVSASRAEVLGFMLLGLLHGILRRHGSLGLPHSDG